MCYFPCVSPHTRRVNDRCNSCAGSFITRRSETQALASHSVLVLPDRQDILELSQSASQSANSPPRRIQTKFELPGAIDERHEVRSIRVTVLRGIDTTITAMMVIIFGGIATSHWGRWCLALATDRGSIQCKRQLTALQSHAEGRSVPPVFGCGGRWWCICICICERFAVQGIAKDGTPQSQ